MTEDRVINSLFSRKDYSEIIAYNTTYHHVEFGSNHRASGDFQISHQLQRGKFQLFMLASPLEHVYIKFH